jgi:hypothetical protein
MQLPFPHPNMAISKHVLHKNNALEYQDDPSFRRPNGWRG